MNRRIAFAWWLCSVGLLAVSAQPALAVRICSYNLLQYNGSSSSSRTPGYKTVLNAIQPDVLVVQEMGSPSNQNTHAAYFLANVLNAADGPGGYLLAPFHGNGSINNACFYRPAKVTFLGHTWLDTAPRDTDRWQFRLAGYTSSAASFYIYSMHLHATDAASRDTQTAAVRLNANGLPAGTNLIYVGDFNIDSSTEQSYQNLIQSQLDNDGRALDPILSPGAWSNNCVFDLIHTQSPRTTDLGDGGATGGLDDRFDFQLVSFPLFDFEGMSYVSGTYRAYGNDGNHCNQSIIALPTIPEGSTIANALHTNSDHLPVIADYQAPALSSADASLDFGTVIVGATAEQTLTVTNVGDLALMGFVDELTYTLVAPAGFTAPGGTFAENAGGGSNAHTIGMSTAASGDLAGTLTVNSDDVDNPTRNVPLSGTVLDHAVPSTDGDSEVLSAALDFGTNGACGFDDLTATVHNLDYDPLQALLNIHAYSITGPDAARFSVTDFSEIDVGATPASFTVRFDDLNADAGTLYTATLEFSTRDPVGIPGATDLATVSFDLSAFVLQTGVPIPNIVGAVSRKPNPSGGNCDTNLMPAVRSEPHQGGVTEVRIAFDVAPGETGSNPLTIEEATCASPAYTAYSGASTVSFHITGNHLVVNFSPGLENGRTYRITVGCQVTSLEDQFVEVRGLLGDVNGDGQVNATDRSVVVGAWTGGGFSCPTDVNNDGITNATDRSIVVGAWTGSQDCAP